MYDCTDPNRTNWRDKGPEDKKKKIPSELVLRRGDDFIITIHLDRQFNKQKNDMSIELTTGEEPKPVKGTLVNIEVDEDSQPKSYPANEWGAQLVSQEGNSATIRIHIPANCIVGEWNLFVKSFSEGKDKEGKQQTLVFKYAYPEEINIIFNPWCQYDTVYMETTDLLKEYVLNDQGCVYRGTSNSIGARPWNFGQFEDSCFEAAMYILRCACRTLSPTAMADPVRVSRFLAQMVNAPDDSGVLVGNWSGNYAGGTSPSFWVGSVKILEQYMLNDEPVKYGQCWVFSGVLTTVCRSLGIPCRSVTCFASAHDTDQSNTIDYFYRKSAYGGRDYDENLTADSVWNFHVWNEAWMQRPDLRKPGYNGWQVIDATPQELSDGMFTCGPCPVAAVKNGECDLKYDAGFIFSEVNADKVHWEYNQFECTVFRKMTADVGKCLSTKVPDGYYTIDRLDVTHEYKHAEGTEMERAAVKRAYETAVNPRPYVYDDRIEIKSVDVDIIPRDRVLIGADAEIIIVVKNPGKFDRKLKNLNIKIFPESYTGEKGDAFLKKIIDQLQIASRKEEEIVVPLKYKDYSPHLGDFFMVEIQVTGEAEPLPNTKPEADIFEQAMFRFIRPDIDVKSAKEGSLKDPVEFTISFRNPLPVPLTKCSISAESTNGFFNIEDHPVPDIPAKAEFKWKQEIKPKKTGVHSVSFSFDSEQLHDVSGSGSVKIV